MRDTFYFHRKRIWITLLIWLFLAAFSWGSAPALAASADSFPLAQLLFSQNRPEPATQPSTHPLLAAGDGESLWFVRPLTVESKTAGFEILLHSVNRRVGERDLWLPVSRDQQRFFAGTPAVLAAIKTAQGPQACIIMNDGQAVVYGLESQQPMPRLPEGVPIAAVGSGEDVFVLARAVVNSPTAAATVSTQSATASSQAATRPVKEKWLLWQYRAGRWQELVSPGRVTQKEALCRAPSATARIQLVRHGDEVVLLWIEPYETHRLLVRRLKFRDSAAQWTEPARSDLPEDALNFHAFGMSPRMYVLWIGSDGRQQVLSAGTLDSDFLFSNRQRIDRVPLGIPSATPVPSHDLVIARTGDSIAVLYELAGKESPLGSVTFSTSGRVLYPAQEVAPQIKQENDSNVIQHSAMILLILLLAVSLWQWRKRPMNPNLPRHYKVARLYQRFVAALIDLAVAFGAVVLIFGLYEDDLGAIMFNWFRSIIQLDQAVNPWPFVSMFAIYIGHVTICELLTGRTLGKKIVGIRVVAIDGSKPTKLSILLRNLMRVPELATRILLIYMVINDQRQRLGDLIARTTVISDKPAEEENENSAER